jgi:probable addiction module antidote protein
MSLKTYPFDMGELLDSEEGVAEYLRLVCEDGSPTEIARALGDIARARGMSEIAKKAGLAGPALHKARSGEGNPELATIAKVAAALGLQISVTPRTKTKPTKAGVAPRVPRKPTSRSRRDDAA